MTSTLSANAGYAVEHQGLPPSMVERMTLILDLFERPQTRLTLEEVARRTRLPRSTAHRILEQLARVRWLNHTTVGYRLGERSLGLGGREIGHSALRAAAAPKLHELAVRTELVVHLAVLDGTEVYYLDKIGGRSAVDVPSRVGARAPAHCTALGKAMLAWLTPELVDAEYRDGVGRRTPHSIGELGTLHRDLCRVRDRNGVAFERGECFPSIACVGVALPGPEDPVGAISLVGDLDRPLDALVPLLIRAARAISDELFHPGVRDRSGARAALASYGPSDH
ncbi:IclR family transcriptional regulator [Amycolatopsis sp. YIM 10]|uniref:IclR family transcriptional regulator n=1 Tax=Amycolatopsis sp. YIM 10 TaxID=2653857 RepID=UPI0012A843C3|nr:IclR family transcriptional regulator [Amycolatopsis sp. YIM 10]QFU92490.1 putative HTH-type transcriptional regulator RhmR [Amycolatopsis sp. YIM 10]